MSNLEESLLSQIREAGLPEPVREHIFAPPRRWRFDFCWPTRMIAVEVEGGVWIKGRHTRGSGFVGDIAKYNRAVKDKWAVYRVYNTMIQDGSAIQLIEEALRG